MARKTGKKAALEELRERRRLLLSGIEEIKDSDPFWYYKPSGGILSEEGGAFLRKWLKEGDVPDVMQGQMDVHRSLADILAIGGGNQGGKSSGAAVEVYMRITGEVPKGVDFPKEKVIKRSPSSVRVVGVDFKTMLNTLIPTYQKWVPRKYLKGGSWKNSFSAEQNRLSLYRDGKVISSIEFLTNQMNVESFQGPPLDLIVYDEEPRRDIWKENLLRFTTSEKLNIILAMTPTKGLTWIWDDVFSKTEHEGNRIETIKMPSVMNPKANLKVLEEIMKGLSVYDERRMRLLGDFISLSGLVYGKVFNRSVHVIEPFPITDEFVVYRGVDPHLVKPSVCVELAVDREENEYVIGCYSKDTDTQGIKDDLAERSEPYRLGWTICDKSANSTIKVLGDRNIYYELKTGKNAIPALFTSEKYTGSINAGVDQIKQLLKPDEKTGRPKLYIFDIPENYLLINAMETMERDMGYNEDVKGIRDKIAEAKHDAHAALRYIHQRPVRWLPPHDPVFEYVEERYI